MKKLDINLINQEKKEIELSFHDVLLWTEIDFNLKKIYKNVLNYLIVINLFFVVKNFIIIFKQTFNTLWRDFLNNFIKYWFIIYLIPLFTLGIILPAALTPEFIINTSNHSYDYISNLWISWISVSAFFIIFISPYSILLFLCIYRLFINKKYKNELNKIKNKK